MAALGEERTIEQDTAFALRILVDIAIRALSPAVNDPTTAVQVLGAVEDLLLRIGESDLTARGTLRDAGGNARVLIATRCWDDLLALALTEIREYGSTSTQVTRRLRALLEDLAVRVRPEHRAAVAEQLGGARRGAGAVGRGPGHPRVRRPAGPAGHRRPARDRERHHPFGVTPCPRACGSIPGMPESAPAPHQRKVSEPRLVVVALLAAAVGVLGILALMDTDDIWIIVALVVSMGLVAVLLVIDLYRVIDASAPESKGDG